MCDPASFIITKTRVLWSDDDKHETIIKQNNINDKTRTPDFVRVELVPKLEVYSIPLNEWIFKIRQDFLPEWFDHREAELAARIELINWAERHIIKEECSIVEEGMTRIFLNRSNSIVNGGDAWFFNNSTGTINGGRARLRDYSNVIVNKGQAQFREFSTGIVNGGRTQFLDKSKKIIKSL